MGRYSSNMLRQVPMPLTPILAAISKYSRIQNFWNSNRWGQRFNSLPGESTMHQEVWTLFQNVPDGEDEQWVRSAVAHLAAEV